MPFPFMPPLMPMCDIELRCLTCLWAGDMGALRVLSCPCWWWWSWFAVVVEVLALALAAVDRSKLCLVGLVLSIDALTVNPTCVAGVSGECLCECRRWRAQLVAPVDVAVLADAGELPVLPVLLLLLDSLSASCCCCCCCSVSTRQTSESAVRAPEPARIQNEKTHEMAQRGRWQ